MSEVFTCTPALCIAVSVVLIPHVEEGLMNLHT